MPFLVPLNVKVYLSIQLNFERSELKIKGTKTTYVCGQSHGQWYETLSKMKTDVMESI